MKTPTVENPKATGRETAQPCKFIVGVRISGMGKTEHFDPGEWKLRVGTPVLVETGTGDKLGVTASNKIVNFRRDLPAPVPRVIRPAEAEDLEAQAKKEQLEKRAFLFCLEKIAQLHLPMNLSRVVYFAEIRKTVFFFTAEGRVDFRELVRKLAQQLRTKIEMKQVGVRDEAKAITGQGMCGQSLCCSTFLKQFTPVTVRMAKDQGLALNPSKISGVCGRLMCCLQYEHEIYKEMIKGMPKPASRIETADGPGKVLKIDILQQNVIVRLDDESVMTYHLDELRKSRGQ